MKLALEWSLGLLLAGCWLALAGAGAQAQPQSQQQQQEQQQQQQQQQPEVQLENFPYYMRSPIQPQEQRPAPLSQRANIPTPAGAYGPAKQPVELAPLPPPPPPPPQLQQQQQQQPQVAAAGCLYERRHFARLDQCLERRPYPIVGLAAFRNDDLLAQRARLADKHGCSFLLTNGLFKSFHLTRYSLDADAQLKCLDDQKPLQLSLQFSNVTLYYLWQLRCLNYANQLLDDATLNGRTASLNLELGANADANSVCVGSSQNFGFTSLQVSNVEAQVELAGDIYKNWRVTNITLAMPPAGASGAKHDDHEHAHPQQQQQHSHEQLKSTGIREFTFETLDGDELNWRYLNLYENWTRNRLHTNFLEQFRRFVWISLQRCLSESSEKLPVKLVELFGQQRYN